MAEAFNLFEQEAPLKEESFNLFAGETPEAPPIPIKEPAFTKEQVGIEAEEEEFLFPEATMTGDTRATGEAALSVGTALASIAPAGVLGLIAGLNKNKQGTFGELATETIEKAMDTLTYRPESEEAQVLAEKMSTPFEYLEKAALLAGTTVQDTIIQYGKGMLAPEAATIVHTAVMMLPAILGRGKGRNPRVVKEKAISKDLVKKEPPLEGELVPKREGLTPEERAIMEQPGERIGEQLEGEVITPRLPAPEEFNLFAEKAPVVPIEQAALKRTLKDIEVEEIHPEIIEIENPYKPGGPLAKADIIDFSKFDPKQRGAIDPSVFTEGIQKLAKIIDESEVMRAVREATQPLQAGTAEAAGIVKNYANHREVIRETQRQLNKELATFPKAERETMLRSIEQPEKLAELSPRQVELVKEMRRDMEEVLGPLAVQMGILGKVRKNYAKHVVLSYLKTPKEAKRLFGESYFKTWLKTGKRKYETLEEGEAAGIEYLTDFSVMAAARAELTNTIYTKQFVNWVKHQDLGGGNRAIGMAGEELPGYVTINHPAFQEKVFRYTSTITKDSKKYFVNKDKGTVELNGKEYPITKGKAYIDGRLYNVTRKADVLKRNIQVHPDLAGPLKSLLETENPSILMKGFLGLKANAMKVIMYNPAFHGMTVLFKQWPTLPVSKMYNPLHDYIKGYKLNQNKANRIDAIEHNVRFLGGRGYKQDIYGEIEVLRDNILHKADPRLGDALEKAGNFWHGTLLWDRIGDLQMGMYDRFWKQNYTRDVKKFKKRNNRSPDAEEAARLKEDAKYTAGEFSNLIAGAFGKEDFAAGWRNFLNGFLFSRSYHMSNMRLGKYGVGIMPKHLIGQMKATQGLAKADAARAFTGLAVATLFKDLFLLFGTLQGINYAMTKMNDIPDKNNKTGGHFTWNNEPKKELKFAIGTKENGQVVYMASPFRAARDIFEVGYSPQELLANKRNPVFTTAIQWIENRNWKGQTILKDGDAWYKHIKNTSVHLAKGLTGFDTLYSTFSPDDESWRNRYRLLGLQVSHGTPGGMVAGNLRDIQRQQQEAKDMILTEAAELIKRKQQDEAIALMLMNNFTKGEVEGFILRSRHPYAKMLKDMNWKSLYYKATPEQKKRLDNIRY